MRKEPWEIKFLLPREDLKTHLVQQDQSEQNEILKGMKEIYNERIFLIFVVDLDKKDILTETITFHIIADF